jgi:hypothetical protein
VEVEATLSKGEDWPGTRLDDRGSEPLFFEFTPVLMLRGTSSFSRPFAELSERQRNEKPKLDRDDPIASRAMCADDCRAANVPPTRCAVAPDILGANMMEELDSCQGVGDQAAEYRSTFGRLVMCSKCF